MNLVEEPSFVYDYGTTGMELRLEYEGGEIIYSSRKGWPWSGLLMDLNSAMSSVSHFAVSLMDYIRSGWDGRVSSGEKKKQEAFIQEAVAQIKSINDLRRLTVTQYRISPYRDTHDPLQSSRSEILYLKLLLAEAQTEAHRNQIMEKISALKLQSYMKVCTEFDGLDSDLICSKAFCLDFKTGEYTEYPLIQLKKMNNSDSRISPYDLDYIPGKLVQLRTKLKQYSENRDTDPREFQLTDTDRRDILKYFGVTVEEFFAHLGLPAPSPVNRKKPDSRPVTIYRVSVIPVINSRDRCYRSPNPRPQDQWCIADGDMPALGDLVAVTKTTEGQVREILTVTRDRLPVAYSSLRPIYAIRKTAGAQQKEFRKKMQPYLADAIPFPGARSVSVDPQSFPSDTYFCNAVFRGTQAYLLDSFLMYPDLIPPFTEMSELNCGIREFGCRHENVLPLLEACPELKAAFFVEFWSTREVYLAYSEIGCPGISTLRRIGSFDPDRNRWAFLNDPVRESFLFIDAERLEQRYEFTEKDDWVRADYLLGGGMRMNLPDTICHPKPVFDTKYFHKTCRDVDLLSKWLDIRLTEPEPLTQPDPDLTSYVIPSGTTEIHSCMFRNFTELRHLELPDSITSIEEYAFYGCRNLHELRIPDSVTYVSLNAFKNSTVIPVVDRYDSEATWALSASCDMSYRVAGAPASMRFSRDYDTEGTSLVHCSSKTLRSEIPEWVTNTSPVEEKLQAYENKLRQQEERESKLLAVRETSPDHTSPVNISEYRTLKPGKIRLSIQAPEDEIRKVLQMLRFYGREKRKEYDDAALAWYHSKYVVVPFTEHDYPPTLYLMSPYADMTDEELAAESERSHGNLQLVLNGPEGHGWYNVSLSLQLAELLHLGEMDWFSSYESMVLDDYTHEEYLRTVFHHITAKDGIFQLKFAYRKGNSENLPEKESEWETRLPFCTDGRYAREFARSVSPLPECLVPKGKSFAVAGKNHEESFSDRIEKLVKPLGGKVHTGPPKMSDDYLVISDEIVEYTKAIEQTKTKREMNRTSILAMSEGELRMLLSAGGEPINGD